jgi:ribosome-associated protein
VDSREYALLAAEAALDKKAEDVVILDVGPLLVITDYFVICTANNDLQVKAISDEVEARLKTAGLPTIGREGERERQWLLLDFGDMVVHVFQRETRDFYRLEKLWGDVERVEVPGQPPATSGVLGPEATGDPGTADPEDRVTGA